ncbi:MAG: RHS repeat protein [Chitinophagaceae bacterium]|nr:RHS repeat protein [Chitinophagaceae bacterium]
MQWTKQIKSKLSNNTMLRLYVLVICFLFSSSILNGQNIVRPNIEGPAGLQVNTFTGSLFYQRTDMFIPGRGLSIDLSFSYNSADRAFDPGFGYGWTCSYHQFYIKDSATGSIRLYREDGRKDLYEKKGAVFTPPVGIFDQLVEYETGKYRYRTKSGTQYFFENPSHQKLTRIRDRNGNEIILSYNGNALGSISDASGRTVELVWNGNRLQELKATLGAETRSVKYTYTSNGCLASVRDPENGLINYTYNANRMMQSLMTPNRFLINITYDKNTAVEKLVSCRKEQRIMYEGSNLKTYLIERGESKNTTTTYSFDEKGRLIQRAGNCCGFKNAYTYDEYNNIASITDANGRQTKYTYDKTGNLVSETNALNQTAVYQYEPVFNQVTEYIDKAGNRTSYEYDERGNLVKITHPLNIVETFEYDQYGNKIKAKNGRGFITTYGYDSYGYLQKITNALGFSDSYLYDAWGNLREQTDARNNKTAYTYTKLNQLKDETDATGAKTSLEYDGNGNVKLERDAKGNATQYVYDENDNPVIVRDALGKSTINQYDPFGNLVSSIDASSAETKYTYDNLNRLITKVNPEGERTQYAYDANGNRIAVNYPNGNTVNIQYDVLNRVVQTSDQYGLIAAYEYDASGNKKSERNGNGHIITYRYDALNRLLSVTDPAGNAVFYAYDANNNLLTETDRNNRVTQYIYDEDDRQIQVKDALNHISHSAYDRAGNLESVKDANGNTTQYTYDAVNRKTAERFADNSTRSYEYDKNSNLVKRTDAKGQATEYIYDELDRLNTRRYPGSTENFDYDDADRIILARNPNAEVTFRYDKVGRIISETLNGKVTAYQYSIQQNTKTIVYPGGRVIKRELDGRNRIRNIRDAQKLLAEFSYDNGGKLTNRRYANNTSSGYTYNSTGTLATVTHQPGAFVNLAYSYDKAGNPLQVQFAHRSSTEQYTYDALHQVTGYQQGANNSSYTYDAVGNRSAAQINAASYGYQVNAMNAYSSITGTNSVEPVYDANGNTTNDGRFTYGYDLENRMTAVNNGSILANLYDALGRRIQRRTATDTVFYYYDGQQVIEERNSADAVNATYVWGSWIDDAVNMQRSGEDYFYHANHLGSIAAITNQNGTVSERYEYDVYGKIKVYDADYNLLSRSAIGNNYTYTGRQYEWETGFYFYRARTYDPEHGRFMQRDPLGYVDGLGWYGYVENNPIKRIDPFGLSWIDDFLEANVDNPLLRAYGDADLSWLREINNTLAGYSDALTFGLTNKVREWIGTNSTVNKCSGYYTVGEIIGSIQGIGTASKISKRGLVNGIGYLRRDATRLVENAIRSKEATKAGGIVVYHSVEAGVTRYVGITNNLARRAGEHLTGKGITIEPLMKGLSRADAKAVEQALIDIHGLGKNGGSLRNMINSISPKNPAYDAQLQKGYELLKSIGYN